jgi:hypothetical protein
MVRENPTVSETIEVRMWGKVTMVARLYELNDPNLNARLAEDWELSVRRAGYVSLEDPTVEREPRWWVRQEDGVPMLMPMGDGTPDAYEFRVSGPVRERAANEPCGHGSTVEITSMADPRRVLLCNWCHARVDGGPH